jgi:hypothetical protein
MKTIIITLLTLTLSSINAQTYTLGVPVYDTVVAGNSAYLNSTFYPCLQNHIGFEQAFVNQINGVTYYFKVKTSTLPLNSIKEFNTNTVINVGDSIPLTNAIHNFEFAAMTSGGTFNYCLLAIGTPTLANDSFYCKSQIISQATVQNDGCANKVVFDYLRASLTPSCIVNSATSIFQNNVITNNISIVPNPSSGQFTIQNIALSTPIKIIDLLGNNVYVSSSNRETNHIFLNYVSSGIYFLQVTIGDKVITKKIIVD